MVFVLLTFSLNDQDDDMAWHRWMTTKVLTFLPLHSIPGVVAFSDSGM